MFHILLPKIFVSLQIDSVELITVGVQSMGIIFISFKYIKEDKKSWSN